MKQRPVFPVLHDDLFTDREDLLVRLKREALDTPLYRTTSMALLGHRRVGKTEVLKRIYNWLFWEQDKVVPIYITYEVLSHESQKYAEQYLSGFLRQYIAFKRKDPTIITADIDLVGATRQLAENERNEGLLLVAGHYDSIRRKERITGELLDAAIQGPRRVADWNEEPILMMVDEFQHVIEIRDPDGGDPNALGKHQPAVESRWCPHLISGSAVTLLTKEILGRGSLFGRFRPIYIRGLEGYYAIELCHRLGRHYDVAVTDEMAAEIARRTGGNPFYIDCILQHAGKIEVDLVDLAAVAQVIALELTQGTIWSELYRQLNHYFRMINEYGIAKNIFYFATRYQNERINPRKIAERMAHWKVTEEAVYNVLLALSRADLIEERAAGTEFYNIKDPILREFADAWARVDVENETWDTAASELVAKYKRLSGEYANFRGYVAELFIRLLMMKFDGRTVEGDDYFHIPGQVVLPRFMWVDARRVKTPSTPEYQIDVIGMVMPEMWVVEVKDTVKPVGLDAVKKLEAAAQIAAENLHADQVKIWYVSRQGFTRQAERYMTRRRILHSSIREVNELLTLFGLRSIRSEKDL
ncbi:MAG: restriction endonuclease [Candidatus Latescibacteria bacterium]|nr:restriction endonuclease [Candidatus Latescibacterota bacterium]